MLMAVMTRPAMASPRTNLLAPSMAPKNSISFSRADRRVLGLLVVDDAGGQIGVDRHLLAGQGVQGEAGGHLGDAARALGDDREVDHQQDEEDDRADDQAAADGELAEGLDDVAGRGGAAAAGQQDQTGGGHVEAQPEQGGDQQQRGEDREVERLAAPTAPPAGSAPRSPMLSASSTSSSSGGSGSTRMPMTPSTATVSRRLGADPAACGASRRPRSRQPRGRRRTAPRPSAR